MHTLETLFSRCGHPMLAGAGRTAGRQRPEHDQSATPRAIGSSSFSRIRDRRSRRNLTPRVTNAPPQRNVGVKGLACPKSKGAVMVAIALNTIADIDPDEWAIVNGKLYLNNNFFSQALWSLDKSGNIARGDRNWPLVPKLG
jgi:hypothetical protein